MNYENIYIKLFNHNIKHDSSMKDFSRFFSKTIIIENGKKIYQNMNSSTSSWCQINFIIGQHLSKDLKSNHYIFIQYFGNQ